MFQQAVINTPGGKKGKMKVSAKMKKKFWKFSKIKSNTNDK